MRIALAILFAAATAHAATLYVSPGGSHSTPFSTWEAAATNIQSAIDAASAGDTVRVAPGTYPAEVTINKNSLTVQGGNGTLWDADRTFIDRQGAKNSVGVTFSGATNSTLRGFTVMGSTAYGIQSSANGSNTIDSCVIRGNVATKPVDATGSVVKNCIVVGNTILYAGDVWRAAVYSAAEVQSSIIEANDSNNSTPFSLRGVAAIRNSIYVNSYVCGAEGGNITNSTFITSGTGSVCQLYNIAQASSGSGSNLQWAGVAAYIPRIGSLAQGAGVGYPGIGAAKSGDGGPALWPLDAKFLGRDSSTNRNHGGTVGGVTASTDSPFVGGSGSAAFDGASGYIDAGKQVQLGQNFAVEAWINPSDRYRRPIFGECVGMNNDFMLAFGSLLQLIAEVRFSGTSSFFNAPAETVPENQWTHVALTRSNNVMTIWQDGVAIATNTAVTQSSTNYVETFYIGHSPDFLSSFGPRYFSGRMSDVRAWNYPKTDFSDRTNHLTGNEAGLVGYWRLDETDTPIITTGPFNLRNPTLQPTFMEAF